MKWWNGEMVSEYSEYINGFALKQLCQWQTPWCTYEWIRKRWLRRTFTVLLFHLLIGLLEYILQENTILVFLVLKSSHLFQCVATSLYYLWFFFQSKQKSWYQTSKMNGIFIKYANTCTYDTNYRTFGWKRDSRQISIFIVFSSKTNEYKT